MQYRLNVTSYSTTLKKWDRNKIVKIRLNFYVEAKDGTLNTKLILIMLVIKNKNVSNLPPKVVVDFRDLSILLQSCQKPMNRRVKHDPVS